MKLRQHLRETRQVEQENETSMDGEDATSETEISQVAPRTEEDLVGKLKKKYLLHNISNLQPNLQSFFHRCYKSNLH